MKINNKNVMTYLNIQQHNLNSNNATKTLDWIARCLYMNNYSDLVDYATNKLNLKNVNDICRNLKNSKTDIEKAKQAKGDYVTANFKDVDDKVVKQAIFIMKEVLYKDAKKIVYDYKSFVLKY